MNIVGVDPGITGGIAVLYGSGNITVVPMPVIAKEIDFVALARWLNRQTPDREPAVFLERAQAFPKAGASGMFNYGASYWGTLAICATLRIPVTIVAPAKWHRALTQGDDDPKTKAIRACHQLFPSVNLCWGRSKKPHLGIVDALLIAEYGRRQLTISPA